jgi:hypothetical protein
MIQKYKKTNLKKKYFKFFKNTDKALKQTQIIFKQLKISREIQN